MNYTLRTPSKSTQKRNCVHSKNIPSFTKNNHTLGQKIKSQIISKYFAFSGIWEPKYVNKSGPTNVFDFGFIKNEQLIKNFLESDIIFIANQECGRSIIKTYCCGIEKEWNKKLKTLLLPTHIPILNNFLNAIHSVVFVKKTFCLFPKSYLKSH